MSLKSKLVEKISSIDDLTTKKSHWKDEKAFYIGDREIAHFEGPNSIDIRLTRKFQKDLIPEVLKITESRSSSSDWILVHFLNENNLDTVIEVLKQAIKANQIDLLTKEKKIL